jgi:hypothetical protein
LHSLQWLVKRQSTTLHLGEKIVINMIWLRLSISNWLIVMIGPGGLLLVVLSHLYVVPVSVWRVGLQKKYITNKLECEKCFCSSHTEHHWRCSNTPPLLQSTPYISTVSKKPKTLLEQLDPWDVEIWGAEGAFTLGVRDSSVESPNIMLLI